MSGVGSATLIPSLLNSPDTKFNDGQIVFEKPLLSGWSDSVKYSSPHVCCSQGSSGKFLPSLHVFSSVKVPLSV